MTKLDSSMPAGVLEGPVDLSRTELRGLGERYRRSALIVGRSADEAADLNHALLEDGWRIEACAGPASANCPLLKGSRWSCTKRECADVALVFVDASRSVTRSLPLVRCAADPASPSVVILEGQAEELAIDGDRALVGALRTARTIVDAAGAITGRPVATEGA